MFFFIALSESNGFEHFDQDEYVLEFANSCKHIQYCNPVDDLFMLEVFVNEGRISGSFRKAFLYPQNSGKFLGIGFGGLMGFCIMLANPHHKFSITQKVADECMRCLKEEIDRVKEVGFNTEQFKERVFELHQSIAVVQSTFRRQIIEKIYKML